jgi:hypothetical protein
MRTLSHSQFAKDFKIVTGKEYRLLKDTDWYIPSYWFHDIFTMLDNKILTKVLKMWKKESPSEEVLEDFKKSINYIKKDNYFLRLLTYNKDDSELIYLMIHFGLEVDDNIFRAIIDIETRIEKLEINKIFLKRLQAGIKIAKYIEEAMDDKFEMKPLRTKIDLRKLKDLYKL